MVFSEMSQRGRDAWDLATDPNCFSNLLIGSSGVKSTSSKLPIEDMAVERMTYRAGDQRPVRMRQNAAPVAHKNQLQDLICHSRHHVVGFLSCTYSSMQKCFAQQCYVTS